MKNIINREMTGVNRTVQWLLLLAGIVISPALMAQQNAATLDHIQNSSVLKRRLSPAAAVLFYRQQWQGHGVYHRGV